MNALVGVRTNKTGALTATQTERAEAKQKLWANYFATQLGRLRAAQKAAAKSSSDSNETTAATGASAQKSGSTEKSSSTSESSTDTSVGSELDRDAFLQLLVYQMQYQDPMDPMSNEDMIANLAQFSALEQMENLNTSFDQLSALLGQQSIVQASSLLGREVTATAADGQTVAGVVDRVYQQDGELYVEIDGTAVSLSNVSQVTETSETASDTTESDSSESSEG